jgi:molybdopterin molybdotransferase
MITVSDAKKLVLENATSLPPVNLSLSESAGMVIAEDIYASINIPAYPQSSMDGYAFIFDDLRSNRSLTIQGEVAAGSNASVSVSPGYAARIFTGAEVPTQADTVVMQEKTKVENGKLFIEDDTLQPGSNVRSKGSEIAEGESGGGERKFNNAGYYWVPGLELVSLTFLSIHILQSALSLQAMNW